MTTNSAARATGPQIRSDAAQRSAPRPGLLATGTLAVLLAGAQIAHAGYNICTVHGSSDASAISDIQKKLEGTKLFDKVDNIDSSITPPTLMQLQKCDAVLVWTDLSRSGFNDPTSVGNVLTQYIDNGGGVVQMLPYYANNTYSNLAGSFQTKYGLVTQGSMSLYSSPTMTSKDNASVIMTGVDRVGGTGSRCYQRSGASGTAIVNTGKIVASWNSGNALAVVGSPGGHPRVDLNLYPPSADIGSNGCWDASSDALKLITNSILYVANTVRTTPNPADFGDVGVGVTSSPINVTLENTGSQVVTLTSGDLQPTGQFLVAGITFPLVLKPGDKATLEVTARPTLVGAQTASYVMTPAAVGSAPVAVTFTVRGLGPKFDVQPAQIDFGGVPVGKTPDVKFVTVTNAGGGFLRLMPTPTIADTTSFALEDVPMGLPTLLGPSASVTMKVRFIPSAERAYTTSINIPYDEGSGTRSLAVTVRGSFGKPKIQLDATSYILSPVRVNVKGPEQLIKVTNTGLAELSISSLSFSGPAAGEFAVLSMPTMAAPIKVAPNNGVEYLRVQCNPTMSGLRQATLNIGSDDPMTATATVALSCNGTVANFDMQPAKIDFTPTQQTGVCTAAKDVVITNSGTDALKLLSISFMGPNAGSFKQPHVGVKSVPGNNAQFKIPVQFCPVDIGAQSADLVVVTDLMPGHTAKVPLTGTASGPKVVAKPGSIDFGPVPIKSTSLPRRIEITNEGDQPLVFGKSAVNPTAGAFKVTGLPAEGKTLNKGDAPILIDVTATPPMPMQYTGDITIGVNDLITAGSLKIPLVASGSQAEIQVNPMMLTFPVTIIGSKSMEQAVTVTNTGAAPLTGISLSMSGMNASEFGYTGMIPASLPSGQSATFQVSFRPAANGTRSGVLLVNAAGVAAPMQVKLEGTGKLLTVSCNPDEKAFGRLAIGQTASAKIVCSNADTSDIEFVASFTDFADDWAIDPMEGTLPAGTPAEEGLISLNVTFKPTAAGPRTTTLTIKTKDGIAIGSVSLDGEGLPMTKPKPEEGSGCSYTGTGTSTPASGTLVLCAMMLLAGGLLARRRRTIRL